MKTLDCTIRDGGYINKWRFDDTLVRDCYNSLSEAGIDYVEIGFNNNFEIYNNNLCGKWRYVNEELVRSVIPEKRAKIALMADYGKADIDNFIDKKDSLVDLVRVAFHRKDIDGALKYCHQLKEKGYEVSANAMATVHYTDEELNRLCRLVTEYQIDYLYIADSYGSLTPTILKTIHSKIMLQFSAIDPTFDYKLGFHAHNNMQNSLANAIYAETHGFDIIDSTIYGMGRGAGNLCTEIFVSYLVNAGKTGYKLLPVIKCADKHIVPLSNTRGNMWGYSLLWLISAHFSCHPNYISKLKDYNITSVDVVWTIIQTLAGRGDQKLFKVEKLNQILKEINI